METNACWLTESVFGSAPRAAGAAHRDVSLPCLMSLPPGHRCTFHPASAKGNVASKRWLLTLCLAAVLPQWGEGG